MWILQLLSAERENKRQKVNSRISCKRTINFVFLRGDKSICLSVNGRSTLYFVAKYLIMIREEEIPFFLIHKI